MSHSLSLLSEDFCGFRTAPENSVQHKLQHGIIRVGAARVAPEPPVLCHRAAVPTFHGRALAEAHTHMVPQGDWPLLSEALDAADVWTGTFDAVLSSGRVPLRGKRLGHFRGDPIEPWLPRVKSVSILSVINQITLRLDAASADERAIAEQLTRHPGYPGVLLPSDWTVTFTAVRVRWPNLVEELAAEGCTLPSAKHPRPGPKAGAKTDIHHQAWEIARNILADDERRPEHRHGWRIKLARMVNAELIKDGHEYQDDSVREMIAPSLREWENTNKQK